jgi:hypothetical protein
VLDRTGLPDLDFPVQLTPGMGLHQVPARLWKPLVADYEAPIFFDVLLVFEPPQRRAKYVISVDVASGAGQDRSVVEVTRVGDLHNPPEEVAQFVSATIDPTDLAYVCAMVGRHYKDNSGTPAMMAVECNGFGLQTQAELLRHHGYTNFFVWQYEDAADAKGASRASSGGGRPRTRPLIISRFVRAIHSGRDHAGPRLPDQLPAHLPGLQSFQSPRRSAVGRDGRAGPHDDCLIAASIGCHVEQTLYHESIEPLPDHRRRLEEDAPARQAARAADRPATSSTPTAPLRRWPPAVDPDDPAASTSEEGATHHEARNPDRRRTARATSWGRARSISVSARSGTAGAVRRCAPVDRVSSFAPPRARPSNTSELLALDDEDLASQVDHRQLVGEIRIDFTLSSSRRWRCVPAERASSRRSSAVSEVGRRLSLIRSEPTLGTMDRRAFLVHAQRWCSPPGWSP